MTWYLLIYLSMYLGGEGIIGPFGEFVSTFGPLLRRGAGTAPHDETLVQHQAPRPEDSELTFASF